jgi:hypothetical protein
LKGKSPTTPPEELLHMLFLLYQGPEKKLCDDFENKIIPETKLEPKYLFEFG